MSTTRRLNGRHATAIVAAVCVAIILAPLAAQAGAPVSKVTSVKGTVDIGNFPATQKVAGSVNVGNLPATQNVGGTVNVGNLPATQNVGGTVNVGNLPATQPVTGTVTANPGLPGTPFTQLSNSSVNSGETQISVPAGKTLVIQQVSILCAVSTGGVEAPQLEYITGGSLGSMYLPHTLDYTFSGNDFYQAVVPATIYADPGSDVNLSLNAISGTAYITELTVSGYLIA
jgi:hypothetical protein